MSAKTFTAVCVVLILVLVMVLVSGIKIAPPLDLIPVHVCPTCKVM